MALSERRSTTHFLFRLTGLTGLVVAIVGLTLWQAIGTECGRLVALVGGGLFALGLLGEIPGLIDASRSRRGAVGGSVILQILLATVLVVGVNVFSFLNYTRWDWTRDGLFTLPETLRARLGKLRDETEIIVFQRHTAFGQGAERRQDNYDAAAQRKIVEKVRDLAEQFGDLGARFRVQVLDIQDDEFESKLANLRKKSPVLAEAIEKAPEDSIFFFADGTGDTAGRVQRLSFHDVYQLDKKASREAEDGRGNLVLKYQGVGPFADKILNIQERKPRIAFAVVHEYLGLDGNEFLGMAGLKKALATRGFEGFDVILKHKWPRPEATVLTYQENRFERIEAKLKNLDKALPKLRKEIDYWEEVRRDLTGMPLPELNKHYFLVTYRAGLGVRQDIYTKDEFEDLKKNAPQYRVDPITVEIRDDYVALRVDKELDYYRKNYERTAKSRDEALQEKKALPLDNLEEQRRIADLRAKFNRMLADADLLVLPRMTIFNALVGDRISQQVYKLDDAQVAALKDYMKSGRPVLFLLGPTNAPPDEFEPPAEEAIEKMLADLGVEMPVQTILFDTEAEALEEGLDPTLRLGRLPEVPPVRFEGPMDSRTPLLTKKDAAPAAQEAHPVRASLRLSGRSFYRKKPTGAGAEDEFLSDLRLRNPRPVYALTTTVPRDGAMAILGAAVVPGIGSLNGAALLPTTVTRDIDRSAVLFMAHPSSWNEKQPFPEGDTIPRYDPAKAGDPNKGTLREERQGPFPLGVALETRVPRDWYDTEGPVPATKVRLAVIGHGGPFMGESLSPMREKLFLDVANWLIGRDDLLAREPEAPWSYPRVEMSEQDRAYWTWGAWLGLPLIFIYLGMIMLLVRRMR